MPVKVGNYAESYMPEARGEKSHLSPTRALGKKKDAEKKKPVHDNVQESTETRDGGFLLRVDPDNYRKHPDNNKALIKRSLRENGAGRSIVVDNTGASIGGSGVLEQADALGIPKRIIETDGSELVVVVRKDISPDDPRRKQMALADNATTDQSEWDYDQLAENFSTDELKEWEIPIVDVGDDLTGDGGGASDAVSEPDAEEIPDSKPGSIYILGRHRLLCGSCSDTAMLDRLLCGQDADMLLTGPPYGIKRDSGFGGAQPFQGGKAIKLRVYSDDWDAETPDKAVFDALLMRCKHAIIWGGNFFTDKLPVMRHWIVWNKHNTMPTFGDAELAWTNIDRTSVKMYDVVYNGLIGKEKERFHPTQKPVALMSALVKDYLTTDEIVLDAFGGSGTTLVACEQLGRICRMANHVIGNH